MLFLVLALFPLIFALNRPYIGILSQPCVCDVKYPAPSPERCSLIGASAVKWLEAAGANVVPLKYNMPTEDLKDLMSKINGVFLPGGDCPASILDTPDTAYMKVLFEVWNMVKDFNDKGDYFPLWGTCQGFETLQLLAANLRPLTSVYTKNYTTHDISLPLKFFNETQSDSKIFSYASAQTFQDFQTHPISYNMHGWGVPSATYEKHQSLRDTFHRITHNFDSNQNEFVSTIEGKDYPIFGTQWHPEAVIFLQGPGDTGTMCHSELCVNACQFVGNFFVHEARKSGHSFESLPVAYDYVVDQYCTKWFGMTGEYWETQEYVFEGEMPESQRVTLTVGAFVAIIIASVVVVGLLISFVSCALACIIARMYANRAGKEGWALLKPREVSVNGV